MEEIKNLLGIADVALLNEFINLIAERKTEKAIEFLNEVFEGGYDLQEFAKSLIRYLRQAMILKINPNPMNPIIVGLTKEEQENLRSLVDKFQPGQIRGMLDIFLDAENKMKYSPIPQLPLELAIVDIISRQS